MIERHFHWRFMAYNGEQDAERIRFGATVEVIGYLSEADARVAAQDIVTREHYSLTYVYECATCGFQDVSAGALAQMTKP